MEWRTGVSGGGGWRQSQAVPSPRAGVRGTTSPRAAASAPHKAARGRPGERTARWRGTLRPAGGGNNRNRNSAGPPPQSAAQRGGEDRARLDADEPEWERLSPATLVEGCFAPPVPAGPESAAPARPPCGRIIPPGRDGRRERAGCRPARGAELPARLASAPPRRAHTPPISRVQPGRAQPGPGRPPATQDLRWTTGSRQGLRSRSRRNTDFNEDYFPLV